MNRPIWLGVASLALLVSGCPEEQSHSACAGHPICDIRDAECQADLWVVIQCDRGETGGEIPPIRVIDVATFRAELEAELAAYEPTLRDRHGDAALRRLGLLRGEASGAMAALDVRATRTAAYYSPSSDSITVVDRGDSMSQDDDMATLVHEMVHAFQFRTYPLSDAEPAATSDEALARAALIEGDATFHGYAYVARAHGQSLPLLDWGRAWEEWRAALVESVATADDAWSTAALLRYPLGARFVTDIALEGPEGLDALYASPPEGMRDILGGEPRALRCPVADAPAGAEYAYSTRTGPIMVFAELAAVSGDAEHAWSHVDWIGDDLLTIVGDESGERTFVTWRIAARTPGTAQSIATVLSGWSAIEGNHLEIVGGTEVVLWSGDETLVTPEWLARATGPCR